jgi:hypothetical protein
MNSSMVIGAPDSLSMTNGSQCAALLDIISLSLAVDIFQVHRMRRCSIIPKHCLMNRYSRFYTKQRPHGAKEAYIGVLYDGTQTN